MDARLRDLERASSTGDVSAILAYSRELCRAGRSPEARNQLFPHLLAQPASQEIREHYIFAQGFLPERIQDDHLGDAFVYHNLPLGNEHHTIVHGNTFLERGEQRTFDKWKPYFQRNKKGIKLTNAQIEAAIKLGWYNLRDQPLFRQDLEHYTASHRRNENGWPLYGKISYGAGNQATLEECLMNGKIGTRELQIPTLNQNHATLAREQPESQLGTTEGVQNEVLAELFSTEPSQLIAAFQYFTTRRNGNLREVRLWTPPTESRRRTLERALVLGLNVFDDGRFDIDCDVYIVNDRPVVGWRSYAKNFSSGNQG